MCLEGPSAPPGSCHDAGSVARPVIRYFPRVYAGTTDPRERHGVRITIIGASKGTGVRLAVLATSAGHEVTALSRSGTAPDGVRAVAGDAADPAVVSGAGTGADAVVVTVGGAKGARRHRAVVTRSVVRAMEQAGARRLIVQSSLGAGDSGALMPAPLRLLMKGVLAAPLADHNEQEAAVIGSSRVDHRAAHRAHQPACHGEVAGAPGRGAEQAGRLDPPRRPRCLPAAGARGRLTHRRRGRYQQLRTRRGVDLLERVDDVLVVERHVGLAQRGAVAGVEGGVPLLVHVAEAHHDQVALLDQGARA